MKTAKYIVVSDLTGHVVTDAKGWYRARNWDAAMRFETKKAAKDACQHKTDKIVNLEDGAE